MSTGCSDEPAPGPESGAGPSLSVPPVPEPLDAERFREAPCELLSARQASELGLPVTAQERSAGRPTCVLRPADQDPLDTVTIRFQSSTGLAGIARQCANSAECDFWGVDTIEGYPVIRANGDLESTYGLCRLFLGVADDTAILIADGDVATAGRTETEGGPRCDRADRTAAFVINTLEGR
nr:DUF3558 family protein [Actinophytocola xanthii]